MPNTIAQNLQRLVDAKNAISSAITAKGGTVNSGDGLEEFPADIATIPSGGGEPLSPTRSGATIYDFDGSVIATYTPEEFAALTEYPAHPTHEYLTADGYNWPLANAKAYAAKYGYVEVGAQYRVTDGKTRLFIHLEEGRLEPQLGLGINGSVEVDWGDGSAHDAMTGSNVSTTVYQTHAYAQAGDYVIALTVINGSMQFNGAYGYGYILGRSGGNQNTNRVYLNALRSIYICESVTSIGNSSFSGCSSLASITIPEGVTSIRDSTFQSCYGLASITIPESVTRIGNSAFQSCYGLASITIPESVTRIGNSAFYNCYALASVTIPDGVTSISDNAFTSCYSLTSVNIPDGVTSISNNAFTSCYALTSVTIPSSVTSIGSYAFASCYALTSVTIPDGVTSISDNAFAGCYSLTSVNIPDGVTSISNNAFTSCYALTSVTIPDGVTSISDNAFAGCYSLTSVTIPNSVTSISNNAFAGCYGLSYIMIDNLENNILGSPWGASSGDTVVIWMRVARFTSATNEVSSGTTLTTSISCAVGDLIVATFVIRGNTYTISDDWTLLGISESVGSFNQRTGMAYKIAESTTENLTITQNSSERIYTNLVAITGAVVGEFSGFTTQETGNTITMNRPSGLVIWGVSSSLWGSVTPYMPWGMSNTTDIAAVELPLSTQPRCLTALDQGNDRTVSFAYSLGSTGDAALAGASLTVTGISNFWHSV